MPSMWLQNLYHDAETKKTCELYVKSKIKKEKRTLLLNGRVKLTQYFSCITSSLKEYGKIH